jgi:hypothetical protein
MRGVVVVIDGTRKDWRVQAMKQHPRVTYLDASVACTGWMERGKKCRKPARWKFRAMRTRSDWSDSENGTYCWQHLWTQIYTNTEHSAWVRWAEKFTAEHVDFGEES